MVSIRQTLSRGMHRQHSLLSVVFVALYGGAALQPAYGCDFQSCYRVPMMEIPDRAKNGDCSCQLYEAKGYALQGEKIPYDLKPIHEELKLAAEQGDTFAIRTLGDFELYGYVGAKNPTAALMYYKQAAEKNDDDAKRALASLYQSGAQGIPKDFELAKLWYARSAAPGSAGYMMILSQMLSRGQLGKTDTIEAYAWVLLEDKYTNDGTPDAYTEYRKELRAKLDPSDLPKAEERAAVLEKEFFKGAAPAQKLSAAELRQREERTDAIAARLKDKSGADLQKEFDSLLKEYRGK